VPAIGAADGYQGPGRRVHGARKTLDAPWGASVYGAPEGGPPLIVTARLTPPDMMFCTPRRLFSCRPG